MSKTLTPADQITDSIAFVGDNGHIFLLSTRDGELRIRINICRDTLEYKYNGAIHVDKYGAPNAYSSTWVNWRLPSCMRNKIFSTRDKKIVIRIMVDFIEYYNSPYDDECAQEA